MIRCARKTAMKLCSKYGCKNKNIASDALVYILEKRGDIEKNYSDNENLCRELIGKIMYTHIKFSCLRNLRKKNENTHRRFTSHKGSQEEINVFNSGIKDDTENGIQDEVVGEIKGKQENSPEEASIELLSYYIEQGYTREEVLSKTSEELGMSRKKMLKALKKYMLEIRKVRETEDGGYVLGE